MKVNMQVIKDCDSLNVKFIIPVLCENANITNNFLNIEIAIIQQSLGVTSLDIIG